MVILQYIILQAKDDEGMVGMDRSKIKEQIIEIFKNAEEPLLPEEIIQKLKIDKEIRVEYIDDICEKFIEDGILVLKVKYYPSDKSGKPHVGYMLADN